MRVKIGLMSVVMGVSLITAGTAWAAGDPRGVWIDDKGRGGVEIRDCGAKLCGQVVWARDEADANRGCGKQIIGDVVPRGSGLWDDGWIYDPDARRKYDVELKPLDDNRLRVKGYAGMKFFSRSMIWTRAPADIKRCDAAKSKTAETTSTNAPSSEASKSGNNHGESAPAARPPDDSQTQNQSTAPPKPEPPQVTTAEDPQQSVDSPKRKLRDLRFSDGYGLTETGGGNCRLKVPYFSMTFRCTD